MTRNLNLMDYNALLFGGKDGGILVDTADIEDAEVYLIESIEDGVTFTTLSAVDQDGTPRNMISAGANNFAARVFNKGDLVYAPFGGYIKDFTPTGAVVYYALPTSNLKKNAI